MSDSEATLEGSRPPSARQTVLADIAENRRKDPNWNYLADPTYVGRPHPTFVGLMTDAEYDRHMAGIAERHRRVVINPYEPLGSAERVEPPIPQRVFRAALPFGQRIRDVRRALRLTQRETASQLGVSPRSIIRYEQGRSAPLQSAPLLALRRLEAHAQELRSI